MYSKVVGYIESVELCSSIKYEGRRSWAGRKVWGWHTHKKSMVDNNRSSLSLSYGSVDTIQDIVFMSRFWRHEQHRWGSIHDGCSLHLLPSYLIRGRWLLVWVHTFPVAGSVRLGFVEQGNVIGGGRFQAVSHLSAAVPKLSNPHPTTTSSLRSSSSSSCPPHLPPHRVTGELFAAQHKHNIVQRPASYTKS